jgi:branched-chain amino acid transport system permease protein
MTIAYRVVRGSRASWVAALGLALLAVFGAALPYLFVPSITYRFINLFVYLILASMWNLLAGYGGMVSVGQQAYLGIGAYGLVYLADQVGLNAFLTVPLAALLAAGVAVPLSYFAFRLVGGYFAIGTWVMAEVVRLVTVQIRGVGGGSGISLHSLSAMDRDVRIAYTYWIALATAVFAIVLCYLLMRSRLGLALTAIRDEQTAAASVGIGVASAKRTVFVISAGGCGAAGALIALSSLRVQPDSVYSVQWTTYMIFMVLIGGIGSLEGPIIGAVVFFALQEWLAQLGTGYLILLGAVAVAVTIAARRGVWGLAGRGGRLRLFAVGYTFTALSPPRERRRR